MLKEIKVNLNGFITRWETDGEPFAWDTLRWGCVGHDPPWHIVNDTTWKGPLNVESRKQRVNEGLCIDEDRGGPVRLGRGKRGSAPPKNKRCGACTSIILDAKAYAESKGR